MATVKKIKQVTDKEKIRGEKEEVTIVEEFVYDSPKVIYKVTNYKNNGREVKITGSEVDAFLGIDNTSRERLKQGEKEVIIYDKYATGDEKPAMYKIEVIKG
jgi:hypothetical protein